MRLIKRVSIVSLVALCAGCSGGADDISTATPGDDSRVDDPREPATSPPTKAEIAIPSPTPGTDLPEGYPPVPKPSNANDFDVPDQSESLSAIAPIEGKDIDFAPTWVEGTFVWDIDIQTQYKSYAGQVQGDAPGDYWNGTKHTSELVFENGNVDLRSLPRTNYGSQRVILIESGSAVEQASNPTVPSGTCSFYFTGGYPEKLFTPCIHNGYDWVEIEDGFNQVDKARVYYVGAVSATPLTNPVFLKRERFWERVAFDSGKSVRVDPGTTKSVTYGKTTGTSLELSETFTETLTAEDSLEYAGIGVKLSHSTSEAFGSTRTITEETTVHVTHTVNGLDGKTVIFSVWQSVERYTIVDAEGNPYTDPSYTFEDFGSAEVRGDHEVLQSAIFDYE